MVRVAVDAMGGDGAPDAPVEGALSALRDGGEELEVLLVGDPAVLERLVGDEPEAGDRLRVVPADETIGMDEPPARAVRRKADSSIVVGLELQRRGEADAFISAGSTGAVMAASVLVLRPLPGVDRPAVGAMVPTSGTPTLVLDAGANVDARPHHLHQFAHLGVTYYRDVRGEPEPRVGLLNVGEEEAKGDELRTAAHRRLREDPDLSFVGNVEGHGIIEGEVDVLVCDGFAGNVLLKFYESVAGFVSDLLLRAAGDAPAGREVEEILQLLDYREHGGAPLLGVDGVSIICHGDSPPRALRNAVGVAVRSVESGTVEDMREDLRALSERAARRPPA